MKSLALGLEYTRMPARSRAARAASISVRRQVGAGWIIIRHAQAHLFKQVKVGGIQPADQLFTLALQLHAALPVCSETLPLIIAHPREEREKKG